MNQIDFTKLFFEYFGGKPKKVKYELRENSPHFLHDIAFMNGLLHDARFIKTQIKTRGKNLTISIERDCWEIPKVDNELYITKSKLSLTNVGELKWQFDHALLSGDEELWIDHLYVSDEYRSDESDSFYFYIIGSDWKCILKLLKYKSKIALKNQVKPYLYSEAKSL